MLYREARAEKDKAAERSKLTDARNALKEVADAVGDKAIDEITLRLLGNYDLLIAASADSLKERTENYQAAEKAWQALLAIVEKDPKAKDVGDIRTGLAYTQLRMFKNAEAL